MLGIRRGNAFRHVAPHHRPPGGAGRRAGGQAGPGGGDRPAAGPSDGPAWEPPVLAAVAVRGEGIAPLGEALDRHHAFLEQSGRLVERRRHRLAERTRAAVERAVRVWTWQETRADDMLAARLDDVAGGRRSPYDVAAEVVEQLKTGVTR